MWLCCTAFPISLFTCHIFYMSFIFCSKIWASSNLRLRMSSPSDIICPLCRGVPTFSGVDTPPLIGVSDRLSISVPSDDDDDSTANGRRGGELLAAARFGINVIPVSSVSVSDANGLASSDFMPFGAKDGTLICSSTVPPCRSNA